MTNNIELELRAEISPKQFDTLFNNLKAKARLISDTKRLSVMFLGEIGKSNFDIRVRIDSNGKAEIVLKKGDFHTHDRTESSEKIRKDQFIGIVKILLLLGFRSKVTERKNFVFDLGDEISLVLVRATKKKLAYVEIEKMSNPKNVVENKKELTNLIRDLGLTLIKDASEFNSLCDKFAKDSDWVFDGSEDSIGRLNKMLVNY